MLYTENQLLKHSGKWYVICTTLSAVMIGVIIFLANRYHSLEPGVLLILSLVPVLLMTVLICLSLMALHIRIDDHGVNYISAPWFSEWRHIRRRQLISYHIHKVGAHTPVKSSNKKDMAWISKSKRYIVLGESVVVLELDGGHKISLSTMSPEKIKKALDHLMNKQ